MIAMEDVDVLILAGGLGTRSRGYLDVPKVLAPLPYDGGYNFVVLDDNVVRRTNTAEIPLLEYTLEYLAAQGARRCILLLAHQSSVVREFLGSRRAWPSTALSSR